MATYTPSLYWLSAESHRHLRETAQAVFLAHGRSPAFLACMDLLEQHLAAVRQDIFDQDDSWSGLRQRHLLIRALKDICLAFREAAGPETPPDQHDEALEARMAEELEFMAASRELVLDTMGGDPEREPESEGIT